MTAAAMVVSMLPLALSAGGELQAPMGRAIIGGLITSTLLTPVVVTVRCSYLVRERGTRIEPATARMPAPGGVLPPGAPADRD